MILQTDPEYFTYPTWVHEGTSHRLEEINPAAPLGGVFLTGKFMLYWVLHKYVLAGSPRSKELTA